MTEETAKALIEALNRFTAALEAVTGPGFMGGKALQVFHQGQLAPSPQPWTPYPPQGPTWGGRGNLGGEQ